MHKQTLKRFAVCAAAFATSATLPLCAAEVAADEAREAVKGWAALQEALTGKERFAGAEIADVKSYEGRDGRGRFYVVSFEGGGFAVTSGDTEIAPILAYSEDGEFVAGDENPLWVMLTRDVAGRTKRLGENSLATKNTKSTKAGGSSSSTTDDEDDLEYGAGEVDAASLSSQTSQSSQSSANASAWARLKEAAKAPEPTGRPLLKAALPKVDSIPYPIYGPFCETKWNQYDANGGRCYNYYTPSNYLCGCVATAMAQVMRSFCYPTEKVSLGSNVHAGAFVWVDEATAVTNTMTWHAGGARGEVWDFGGPAFGGPYDWENMVANPNAGTLAEAQRQAIGLLCRDCGISVDMNYRLGGSGSSTARIGTQLVRQFGYRNAAVRSNGNDISLTEQLDAYLPSFALGSPCAVGIPGHAILTDGFGYSADGRPYVHYNYGWGASYWYTPPDAEESDTEYPIVKTIVYNIWTPDVDIAPETSIVSGFVVAEDGATPVAGAEVTARDAVTGAEVSAETDASGSFLLCLPPGYDYALTASTNGAEAARKKLGTVRCTAEAVGNKTDVRLVVGGGGEDTPTELLHRWSFEGGTDAERLADTGSLASPETAATVCGEDAAAAVAFADGMVSLSGSGNSKGYVALATNAIPDTATLEIWAREDAVRNWARVFDYGVDATAYTMLAWTGGTTQRNDRFSVITPNASGNIDDMMAPYTPGTMYHIALTYEKDATDGSTMVRVMRRDAKTGELQRMGSRTVANFTMSDLADAVLYLGRSFYEADADANATYDEVRVWSGVLSDAQLKANAVAGPGVADLAEAMQVAAEAEGAATATAIGGHTATRRGRIAYGKSRNGKGSADVDWAKVALSDYTDDGEHEVAELNRAASAGDAPAFLEKSQLRYDGWVEVTADQAGWWTFNQKFDDYFLFAVDGDFAVFNHTYSSAAASRVRVTEGWHRFTVVCGDTYGGYGAEYVFGDMKVPFTVSVNGGEEMAFTSDNFTFGSDSGVVTLTENADWTSLGAVTLSPGTLIDLNGHTLTVAGLAVDGIGGAVVTNTAAQSARLMLADGATTDGVAVAVPTVAADDAPELAHRWSFNCDFADSVGGVDAAKCGTYVSLYGGKVHMGYGNCNWGTGYVDLGTNMLDTTAATIEIWARHDGVESWSRVFDYGADNTHYFALCWTYGTNLNKDRAGAKNSGETATDGTMSPYEIGTDYYIAVTFEQQGDATLVKWQRRDAVTGELQKSGTMTMPDGIQKIADPVLYLGHSQYTSDKDALAAYDEVRVWRGVLTDEQLAASAAAGPDATIIVAADVPQFTPAEPPDPPAQRAAVPNGGFRMMTYNINYAYDAATQTIIEDRIADRIIKENPDFCCLNEIRDVIGHPEATVLAKLTGMHKTFYGEDSQGNCVLSKEEPVSWKWTALSHAGYKRFLVVAEFDNVVVAATHLEQAATETISAHDARMASIPEIRESLAQYAESGKPIFLCGDWNAGPGSDEIALMKEFMTIISPVSGVRTYHGRKATGGSIIDYIAVDTAHADDIYTASAYVIDDIAASDHNPVFAEIYLRPAASTLGWIDESFLTTGRTGAWSPAVAWDAGSWTAELAGENVFTPGSASGGNVVTVDVTAAFDAVPQETATPGGSAQCALWLGTNGNFQVWTTDGWVDVAADGVTPRTGTEYSIRFTIDYRSGRHSVAILDGGTYKTLAAAGSAAVAAGTTSFPIAAPGAKKISRIRFDGEGLLRSIAGRYAELEISGFSEDEIVSVNGGVVRLTGGQAEWLNAFGDKTAVADAFAGLSGDEFAKAYLLNLDVMDKNALDDCVFEIAGISVGDEYIEIGIRLIRPRAVKEGGVAKAINGTLRIYGASTLEGLLDPALDAREVKLMPDDFGDGKTEATATIEKTGREVFFNAAIE